jgi:hypothetical protein
MAASSPCNLYQERIVAGETLDETGQSHVMSCASCGRVASEWLALDAAIAEGLDGGPQVPAGFADRVMAALPIAPAASSRLARLLDRRWLQIALANIGLAVAVTNLLRFVFATLFPVSVGGAP